jgi:predicted homoserine dehydrogenase-like protein
VASTGRVDVFNCLRRADEQSFAGGVYVVVDCKGEESWKILKEKGIPMHKDGRSALLYNPSHLLGVEAPISLLSTVLLEKPSGAITLEHHVDLHACTTKAWKKGQLLRITDQHHHEVDGLKPLLQAASPARSDKPLPYYMAAGQMLACDVPAGTIITREMITPPADSQLFSLRDAMDAWLYPGT